ncbi:MAG: alanine racemase [Clostridia bacterium]|nr:alanine racemase [Clostridia bacterium]
MREYNRVYAQIDTCALKRNIEEIKRRVGSARVMQVIKADAYGHGAIPVANTLDNLVDYFAVAVIEEAVELRKNGIVKPILILGKIAPQFYGDALVNNVTMTVFSYEMAEKLSVAAKSRGLTGKIHIAVDTGMSRIGVDTSDKSIDIIKKIYALPNINIEGIFTHFATADEGKNAFADIQVKRFRDFCDRLDGEGVKIPIRHICNSAGIIEYESEFMDMVRPGIISYGLYPSKDVNRDNLDLTPALAFKTHIVHIKTLPKGIGISYNHTFVTERETVVATIPVGYADGYPRSLSNKGRVLIHGQYAKILGNICMDQFMVDVTGIKDISIDDDVTLIGTDGNNKITAEEVADLAGTINYEIICGIGKRVPRVYI